MLNLPAPRSVPRAFLPSLAFSFALLVVLIVGPAQTVAQAPNQVAAAKIPAIGPGEVRGVFAVRGTGQLGASQRGSELLVEEGADQRLTPASVLKLVVAAASLDRLGPEFRFRTEIFTPASRSRGVVPNMMVVAGGDPSWSEDHFDGDADLPFRQLAAAVRRAGVTHVEGDVIVDVSRVIGRRVSVNWPGGDTSLGYGAAPSALAWRDNRSRVRISPGKKVGARAVLEAIDPIQWRNESTTVSAERDGRGTIEFDLDWGRGTATLRGEYPISERSFTVEVATPNPERRAAQGLIAELRLAGVKVSGAVVLRRDRQAIEGWRQVAKFESPPLREILIPLLSDSNNFVAEMLLRNLGHEVFGGGRLDLGVDAAVEFLVEKVGLEEGSLAIDDGSGLSPFNLLTPRSVVKLLQWSWNQPWRVHYFEAMASDQRGTVHDFWPRAPNLRAKSGTLRHTQCLAGVLLPTGTGVPDPSDQQAVEPVFFAWMVNHSTRDRRSIRRGVIHTLWEWSRF